MELKLVKRMIEETLNEEDETIQNITNVEYIIKEGEEHKGSVSISQYGVNFNLYGGEYDIAEWQDKIESLIATVK